MAPAKVIFEGVKKEEDPDEAPVQGIPVFDDNAEVDPVEKKKLDK